MGRILNIQRFCTQDGNGIRTTVFFKGCPLRCKWCHNPESQSRESELMYRAERCVNCFRCVKKCPHGAHDVDDGHHLFNRSKCKACGKCIAPSCEALSLEGREMSADDILKEVLKDQQYYVRSGGGLTLSGGEPLAQGDFCLELLQKAKECGLHICMETCGFGGKELLARTAEYVDVYLFDYKETDPEKHKRLTGVQLAPILENLQFLDSIGKSIVLRCPIIPGVNDTKEHLLGIAGLADCLEQITEVVIEPYHSFGEGKYADLGRAYELQDVQAPVTKTVEAWIADIQAHTAQKVTKA